MEERTTYCRVCEAHCGLIATVEDGVVTQLRPDEDNPMSQGYACPKGIAMVEIQNDADRVLHPLRRRPDGSGFERVSWEAAMADIVARLRTVRDRHGANTIGCYAGVPATFSIGHFAWTRGFVKALGSPHFYGAASQDVGSRLSASALLYGDDQATPIPDIERTDFFLCLGSNPFVSNGSYLTAPRIRDRLKAIPARGGRVVVVDPRRTETARAFEHVAVRPDADAWLLMSMLHTIFEERLEDVEWVERHVAGAEQLRDAARAFAPEATAARTRVEPEVTRALARDFARAPSAVAYGRTGACRGRFGTLVNVLLDALNAVTGNLDRPGGALFAESAIPLDAMSRAASFDTYAEDFSRVGGFPKTFGELPTAMMAKTVDTPGRDPLRALIISGGNPIATVPNPEELRAALEKLELVVSLDLYVNDTNRHADYVLPAATWLERSETANIHNKTWVTPFIQCSEQVVPPRGEAREEWEVVEELGRGLGVSPMGVPPVLQRLGLGVTPARLVDGGLRLYRYGDRFGLRRGGLSLRRLLRDHPHGVRFLPHHPTGVMGKFVRHDDGRVQVFGPEIAWDLERLLADDRHADDGYPLALMSLRELRSHNSWMHNSPKLMRNRRFALRMHPDDAAAQGVEDGALVRLESRTGSVEVPVAVTDEMLPGTVAMPWGWGHDGGWRLANAAGGVNLNALVSSHQRDLERGAGMTWLNGVPVRVEAAASAPDAGDQALAAPATG